MSDWTLLQVVLAALLSGVLSVVCVVSLSVGLLARLVRHLVSLAAGLLLSTALLQLLPEAFESDADPHRLGQMLLAGLLGLFVLEKFSVLRHTHHHESDGHFHGSGYDRASAGPGGLFILLGNSVHNFTDGVAIAVAFAASPFLGWLTSLAISAHAVPQTLGDFVILLNAGFSRSKALAYNLICAVFSALGAGVAHCFLQESLQLLPYILVLAAASFIYIALADLIPGLHEATRRNGEWRRQLCWLASGVLVVVVVGHLLSKVGLHH